MLAGWPRRAFGINMEDLQDLYQEIILSHNKRPRNEGELPGYTHEAEGYNPLCGDRIRVFLKVENGVVVGVAFHGDGCAISRASASMMTERLKSCPAEDIEKRVAEVVEMLAGPAEPNLDLESAGDLAALAGVRKFPARIKCATLAWHAAEEAYESGGDKS
ncbi:MAG: Fe-S cluster assembly sulfur transfer protein SufU [Verrucomicrobiales bacterium]